MRRSVVLLAGSLAFTTAAPGKPHAAILPPPLKSVSVAVEVERQDGAGSFTYRYRISSPSSNQNQIVSLDIEVSRRSGEAVMSREGLVNGPRYRNRSSEEAFQRVPMVPVGISGPQGWTSSLGFDDSTPVRGYAGWGTIDKPHRVSPGRSLDGFRLVSPGLPGIRSAKVEPSINFDELPDEYEDADKAKELTDSLIFWTRTIGPKAPPEKFVSLEFLNYLITLLHDSRAQKWIKVDGVHQSLLAKLLAAKRALEAGRSEPATGELKAFLQEVQAVSCQEFSCPGNKPLTSEAYALLYFNGQYLLEHLDVKGTPGR